jgi:hypothetical protein
MCLRFMFVLITRLAAWLRLARYEETWKTAEILILRRQLALLQRRQPRRPRLDWADRALLATLLAVIPKSRRYGLRRHDADVAARIPAFRVPGDLASAPTVALAYDETEGLTFLANFALVREAFENPGLAADSEHRLAVLGYLKADSISALPFRRLAGADTAWASQFFQHLLKEPSFSWERDGEALLR